MNEKEGKIESIIKLFIPCLYFVPKQSFNLNFIKILSDISYLLI